MGREFFFPFMQSRNIINRTAKSVTHPEKSEMAQFTLVNIKCIYLPLSRFQPASTKAYGIEGFMHENTYILLEIHFNSKFVQWFVTPNMCLERNSIQSIALFPKMLLYLFQWAVLSEMSFFQLILDGEKLTGNSLKWC